MNRARIARGIGALGLLAALAAPFIYISALSPIVHDLWGVVGRFDSVADIPRAYARTYLYNNPRLGGLALYVAGFSLPARVLVLFGSLAALTLAAFAIITGRLFRPYVARDVMIVAVFLSLLWLIHPEIGQQFFYAPYTTNYLLGYAVLLAFLVPYRIALMRASYTSERWLVFALPILGLAAGLTNEHTPPIYIAMIALAVALLPLSAVRRKWMVAGLFGLIVGFLLLFFAPGQSRRYGGIKFRAMEFDWDSKIASAGSILKSFAADGWSIALIAVIVLASAAMWFGRNAWRESKHDADRDTLILVALLVISAVGMAIPLIVSPLVGHRLLFASHVNIAMAATAVLLAISTAATWRIFLGVVAFGINAHFLYRAHSRYAAYHAQFAERVLSIERQKAQGLSPVVVPRYRLKFDRQRKYLHEEPCRAAPSNWRNGAMARYFGVPELMDECSRR